MKTVTVIKVGGAVVEEAGSLGALLRQFSSLTGLKVLVHGGGRSATRLAERLGIPSRMVDGRRVTDGETLRVVTMVYGGLVNKDIVARLQGCGVNALGLTGADVRAIVSHRRPVRSVTRADGSVEEVDYGFVGDVDRVDGAVLARFMEEGIVPVIAPLSYDGEGGLLNTNADTIASEVACALAAEGYAVTLVYCFEKPGVLLDADDEGSVIPLMRESDFRRLVGEGAVSGGMIPKLENAFAALARGAASVVITRADCIVEAVTGAEALAAQAREGRGDCDALAAKAREGRGLAEALASQAREGHGLAEVRPNGVPGTLLLRD